MQQQSQPIENPIHFPPTTHPKIKPLIHLYPRERYLNEENLQNSLILRSKASRVITTRRAKHRRPSSKFVRKYTELLRAQNSLSRSNCRLQNHCVFENVYLSSQFKNLSLSISSLNLQIQDSEMSGIVPRILLKRLRLLKSLTRVKISFISFDFRDSRTFARLFKSLLWLKKLKDFSLNFILGGHSKGNQMDIISKYLQRLTQLRALQLNFYMSMNPPDNGDIQSSDILNNLPSLLLKLTHLTKVHLNFLGRKNIEAEALHELFKSLQTLKNLSDFTLNLPLVIPTNQNPSEMLSESLVYLNESSLRKLSLHLHPFFDF